MRETMMIHTKPAFSRLAPLGNDGEPPDLTLYQDPTPFTEQKKQTILAEGIVRYEPIEVGFDPISFSDELVPATPLDLPEVPDGIYNQTAPMGSQTFYTWRNESDPLEFLQLRVSGGHIVHYRNIASPVQVSLFADVNPIVDEIVAFDNSVPPDGTEHDLIFRSEFPGLHRIQVVAPSNRAKVDRLDPGPMTLPASLDHYNQLTGTWTLYFYVPRHTQVVGGFSISGTRGLLKDGSGNIRCDFSMLPSTGYFHVAVPKGEDGRLWKFEACRGRRTLLTVPPYMARNAVALLLPREVVERDGVPLVPSVEPVPVVRATLTRERLPGSNVIVYASDLDLGSIGGFTNGIALEIVDRVALAANPGDDTTPIIRAMVPVPGRVLPRGVVDTVVAVVAVTVDTVGMVLPVHLQVRPLAIVLIPGSRAVEVMCMQMGAPLVGPSGLICRDRL